MPCPIILYCTAEGPEKQEKVLSLTSTSISLANVWLMCGVTPSLAAHEAIALWGQSQGKKVSEVQTKNCYISLENIWEGVQV